MSLVEIEAGKTVRIVGFSDDLDFETRLRPYGLFPGNEARVLRLAPLGGPFLVDVAGREVALGRDIASQILVEVIECGSH